MTFHTIQDALQEETRLLRDRIHDKLFAQGKPLAFFYPLFEAADSFFCTPTTQTSGTCHIRDSYDYKRMMITVVFALVPCLVVGLYNVGYQANVAIAQSGAIPNGWRCSLLSLLNDVAPQLGIFEKSSLLGCFIFGAAYWFPIYFVTMVVGLFWELVFASVYKHDVNEGFFVTGFIFPLILPPTVPLWQVALSISFGVVIGKEIFGGTGRNFLNPALVARAFLFFSYSHSVTGDQVWRVAIDGVSKATPLACASKGGLEAVQSSGYTALNSFLGVIPGAIGETSTLACLIGMTFLLVVGVISWRIVLWTFLGGLGAAWAFTFCSSETIAAYPTLGLGPIWHFILGGFAFGAVFMATDPVTAAATHRGQRIYGFVVGALIVVVRAFNPAYPEGVMLVILFGNCFAPALDHFVVAANIRRRMKRLEATK